MAELCSCLTVGAIGIKYVAVLFLLNVCEFSTFFLRTFNLRFEGIHGPGMLRIPAFKFLPHVFIGVFPKTGEVWRNLLDAIVWC